MGTKKKEEAAAQAHQAANALQCCLALFPPIIPILFEGTQMRHGTKRKVPTFKASTAMKFFVA